MKQNPSSDDLKLGSLDGERISNTGRQETRECTVTTAVLSIVTTQKLELLSLPIAEIPQYDIPTLTKITLTKHKENKGCC